MTRLMKNPGKSTSTHSALKGLAAVTSATVNFTTFKAAIKSLAVCIAASMTLAPAVAGTMSLDDFNENGVGGAPVSSPTLVLIGVGTPVTDTFTTGVSSLSTSAEFSGTARTTTIGFSGVEPTNSVGIGLASNGQLQVGSPLSAYMTLDLDYAHLIGGSSIFEYAGTPPIFTGLSLVGANSTNSFDLMIDVLSLAGSSTYSGTFTSAGSDIDIDFASFTGNADFAAAQEINFSFLLGDPNASANDFTLEGINVLTLDDPIAVVPLPATLPLILLGIGTLGAIRRMRKS